jgi:hypothetical protein
MVKYKLKSKAYLYKNVDNVIGKKKIQDSHRNTLSLLVKFHS